MAAKFMSDIPPINRTIPPMNTNLSLFLAIALLLSACGSSPSDNTVSSGIPYEGSLYDVSPTETCQEHLTAGNPDSSDQILCREGYVVGYNYSTKQANWVQYHITAASVSAGVTRVDSFREDTEIPSISRSTLNDYSGSGYDRGHMAANATMDFSVSSMNESFLLSNISPQLADFNRAGWADLEQYVRDCAEEKGELIVATGPIFNSTSFNTIGAGVAVPDAYYKVILKPGSPASGFAFKIPHAALSNTELENYVTTIDNVEAAIGIDFFSAIRDDVENPVERISKPICPLPWNNVGSGSSGSNGGSSGFAACGTKTTCGQMSSCAEAYYFLNTCGRTRLDGDGDGVPCESICR